MSKVKKRVIDTILLETPTMSEENLEYFAQITKICGGNTVLISSIQTLLDYHEHYINNKDLYECRVPNRYKDVVQLRNGSFVIVKQFITATKEEGIKITNYELLHILFDKHIKDYLMGNKWPYENNNGVIVNEDKNNYNDDLLDLHINNKQGNPFHTFSSSDSDSETD